MRAATLLVIVAGATACGVSSNVVQCEEGRVCPEATVCDEVHKACVLPEQLSQCEGMADREPCTILDKLGSCQMGVCLEIGCGNGRNDIARDDAECDETTGMCARPYEVCDDGNNNDGDGCSGNCLSEETCGNFLVDSIVGEQCDDGNLLDHDGCSSACRDEAARWVSLGEPGPLTNARAVYDAARDKVVIVGGRYVNSTGTEAPVVGVTEWDGTWHRNIPTGPAPTTRDESLTQSGRISFGLAYDHHRRMTIMAGGTNDVEVRRDVWGWDGASWTRLPDLPVALEYFAMAYDAKRERVVVFGGETKSAGGTFDVQDRTYELTDTGWMDVSPAASPPGRVNAEFCYDPKRNVMVMYGGNNFGVGSYGRELWEYDGTTWAQKLGTSGTHAFIETPKMAFDPTSNRCAIYGTPDSNGNVMLLWDGTTISQYAGTLPVAPAPSATTNIRVGAALVPDGTGRLMLYGGNDQTPQILKSRLLWFFDGAWTEAELEPPPAFAAGVTWIPDQRKLLRFSGGPQLNQAAPVNGQTWELTRRGWKLFTTTNPPGLVGSSIAHDWKNDTTLLFGGQNSAGVVTNRTWTRVGTTWIEHPATGNWPAARFIHSLVYDAARGEFVLFGGADTANNKFGDTWVWNGSSWIQRTPVHSPEARSGAALGYDWSAGVVVLFSGVINVSGQNDTWIWDGVDWHEVETIDTPPSRSLGTFAWNAARQTLVIAQNFGGSTSPLLDAWEWKTTGTAPPAGTWSEVPVSTRPNLRGAGAMYPTPDGSGVTLRWGLGNVNGTLGTIDDPYELRFDVAGDLVDSCVSVFDSDGDGLVGCGADGDPDCWRTCMPECPPGTSCPASAPTCGNGTCDVSENCRICAEDCTCTDTWCGDFVCDPGEACPGDCP